MSTISKLAGSAVLGLALFIPAFALAQTSTTGLLNVYVQVLNQSGYSYSSAQFMVSVAGNNPSPSTSFVGSQSGTLVSLSPGAYAVTVQNTNGFVPTYSVGCNSTIYAGQSQTCVITMSANNGYNYQNYMYSYPYNTQPPFSCQTNTPTVGLGQTASFTAVGGVGGTYNWRTATQNYPNVGPVLSIAFQDSGSQVVSVTNGAQTASCTVNVTTTYYPQPVSNPNGLIYPVAPTYQNYPYQTYSYQNQTYPYQTQTYYPRLPNTGFTPSNGAEAAFAIVFVTGAAIAVYPYARKAFALAVR
jgi:hypothetical protein